MYLIAAAHQGRAKTRPKSGRHESPRKMDECSDIACLTLVLMGCSKILVFESTPPPFLFVKIWAFFTYFNLVLMRGGGYIDP